ncbi:MAG: FAD-dependent 5-carboxymethylaminomethyl-2-thiouridine(34) oxidoreductase MnmC [Cocleimonas sp.]|nr:FAD-dependent 5-carboxymethylaminomethyl-2-thiouridine(34) oxidoreductase MnmC [Cocleimonas sp.]
MPKSFQNTPWFNYPEYHWKTKHVVIVGGGIAGCQMAWHLCQVDWQVTLIERHNELAKEASGNPIGVILPKMTSQQSLGEDFYTQSFDYTLSLLDTLKQQGKTIDWQSCGALQLTHNLREEKRWQALAQREFSNDFLQSLNEDETSQIAGIDLPYKSSYFPQAGWINPASFCQALSDHPNCKVITESEALIIKKQDTDWVVLNNDNKTIAQAEAVIICNGRDLFGFEQSNFLPNMPVAGQTTFARASDESNKLKTVIGHEGYLTPAINSQHIFGATFERDQNAPTLNLEADKLNQQQLERYLPDFSASLSKISSAHSAVRMTTPDRYPYVGALPDKDFYQKNYNDLHQGKQYKKYPDAMYQNGLFILGGLGSRGLTTSGLCAKSLCDLLNSDFLDKKTRPKLLQYCHPARFLIKSLRRNETL